MLLIFFVILLNFRLSCSGSIAFNLPAWTCTISGCHCQPPCCGRYLMGATGEISNFYNSSARLLIFNTHIPPIINTHTSKFHSRLSDTFSIMIFFFFWKRAYFQNLSPRTNLKCMIKNFFLQYLRYI